MFLRLRISGAPVAKRLYVCRKRKLPLLGETFDVVDKRERGAEPFTVRLREVQVHTGGGDIYCVERV